MSVPSVWVAPLFCPEILVIFLFFEVWACHMIETSWTCLPWILRRISCRVFTSAHSDILQSFYQRPDRTNSRESHSNICILSFSPSGEWRLSPVNCWKQLYCKLSYTPGEIWILFSIVHLNTCQESMFPGLCYLEDVMSQLCLLPTDWSFVKDVLCCFWLAWFHMWFPQRLQPLLMIEHLTRPVSPLTFPSHFLAQGHKMFPELTSQTLGAHVTLCQYKHRLITQHMFL